MCKSSLHSFLVSLPKCEQHMHIEGALTPATLFNLARRNGVSLPKDDPAYSSEESLLERYKRFSSLDDFLGYYYTAMAVLVNSTDFEELAWSYFKQAHSDGVVHSEIFFDPQAHTSRGVTLMTIVEGLQRASKRAEEELGISTRIISCFLRHEPVSGALELFESDDFQKIIKNGTICGIGLDSSENNFPPELFTELYDKARAAGLRVTAHAGEEGPARNIAASLSVLGCERIDHGIKLATDRELMKEVAAKNTLLTVCPMSNVYLKAVNKIEELPIKTFLDSGVRFSINSDDPAYLGGFILTNYCAVQDAFNLTVSQWATICTSAIEGSWCEDKRKDEMKVILEKLLKNTST